VGRACSGLLLARPFPIPGQELIDPLRRMILQARQDVGEPGLRSTSLRRAAAIYTLVETAKAIPTWRGW